MELQKGEEDEEDSSSLDHLTLDEYSQRFGGGDHLQSSAL